MYTCLAGLYDNPVRDAISRATVDKIAAALGDGPILDLACGTGLISTELASRSRTVIGVDRSPAMLELARARSRELGVHVDFRCGDIRELHLEAQIGVALCFGDVINHLLDPSDVARTFAGVFRALVPGGLFLFDTSTLALFSSALWNAEEHVDLGDGSVHQIARFDPATRLGVIATRVELDAEIAEDRIEERHHDEHEIRELLRAAGFTGIEHEPWNPIDLDDEHPDLGVAKRFWRARKPACRSV